MRESEICFYKTRLNESNSTLIDDIQRYLGTCDYWDYPGVTQTVQFLKPNYNLTIVLDLDNVLTASYSESQDILYTQYIFPYNYMSIEVINDGHISLRKYYFVSSYEWSSAHTIRINLTLDVLNTYMSKKLMEDLFMPSTQIIREHRDRFVQETSKYTTNEGWELVRNIDKESEGFDLPKYLVEDTNEFSLKSFKIQDKNYSKSWYLIYKNETYEPGSTDERLPITCQLVYDDALITEYGSLQYGNKNFSDVFPDFGTSIRKYTMMGNPGLKTPVIRINGQVYIAEENKTAFQLVWGLGSVYFTFYKLNYNNGKFVNREVILETVRPDTDTIVFVQCDFLYCQKDRGDAVVEINAIKQLDKHVVHAGKEADKYINGINDIDKTNPKIIKIIKIPYSPTEVSKINDQVLFDGSVWFLKKDTVSNETFLEMYNVGTEFNNIINAQTNFLFYLYNMQLQQSDTDMFNYVNESKLLNSEYTTVKLVYDSFEYQFPLEYKISTFNVNDPAITFKMTNTINSNFLFSFKDADFKTGYTYPNILAVKRNNEVLILNSPYLNYVNNGYNYDKKHRAMDITTGIIGNTIGLVGQGVAIASGGISGSSGVLGAKFGSSLIMDTMNTVTSAVKSEDNIKRRLVDLNNSSVNISGSDDIDLLSFYSDNKLWYKSFMIREELQKSLAYLFHLIGYSYPYKGIPDFDTRYWFNFVQCKPVFDLSLTTTVPSNFLDIIRDKFENGVTYFHEHNIYWDLDQERENYETWIMEV